MSGVPGRPPVQFPVVLKSVPVLFHVFVAKKNGAGGLNGVAAALFAGASLCPKILEKASGQRISSLAETALRAKGEELRAETLRARNTAQRAMSRLSRARPEQLAVSSER